MGDISLAAADVHAAWCHLRLDSRAMFGEFDAYVRGMSANCKTEIGMNVAIYQDVVLGTARDSGFCTQIGIEQHACMHARMLS